MLNTISGFLLSIVTLILLSGCGVKDLGQTIGNSVQGDYYLNNQQYEAGLATFKQRVEENGDNATSNYYYARFLLHNDSPKTSLKYFEKASKLSPQKSDYMFWHGVAYGELGDVKMEEKLYRKALSVDENHLQSLVFLGHNLFQRKNYTEALSYYSKAIDQNSKQESALYNRGLILQKLNRTPEELEAWKAYLHYYSFGVKGRKATDYLNLLGDYSYRNYYLGSRSVTVPKISFMPFTDQLTKDAKASLTFIGKVAGRLETGRLQIIVYQENNKQLAKDRAIAIKNYLLESSSSLYPEKIGVSWFASPQYLKIGKKKKRLDDSVQIFISKK